ncbi:MAG: FMN-binding protein [Rhodocyclaceae bacterium]|nr:FMN-binding protein [Rhodocyclaceae bacterium]
MNTQVIPVESTPTAAMIRTLGVVSTVCGLIIVGAFQGTFSAVQENKRLAVERAVFKVIPAAKSIVEYQATPAGIQPLTGEAPAGALKFYATYDGSGRLAGIAAEGGAKGYADTVRILYGYTPDCRCVVGIGVVSMRETPGIGDKILTDKDFLANFAALDVQLNAELSGLAQEVKAVKHGTKTKNWEIDAIAGATITSRAVGRAINDSAQALLPKIAPHLEKIRSKP